MAVRPVPLDPRRAVCASALATLRAERGHAAGVVGGLQQITAWREQRRRACRRQTQVGRRGGHAEAACVAALAARLLAAGAAGTLWGCAVAINRSNGMQDDCAQMQIPSWR